MAETLNEDQIAYWNGEGGEKFVKFQHTLDTMLAPYGAEVLNHLAIQSGEAVLDIGCGCGDTTIDLARRVGAKGEAVGVDISEPMLAQAEEAARHAELTNVFFEVADVESGPLHRDSFDAAFSRFGVMFFEHPEVAFANVHKMLHERGRLGFVCWQPMEKNPWIGMQVAAVMPFAPEVPPPPGPDDPGPFSFGDPDRIHRVLGAAGFKDIAVDAFTPKTLLGATKDLDEAVAFGLEIGPAGTLLAGADDEARARAAAAVRDVFAPYHTPDGVVMDSAAWVVTARK